MRPIWVTDLTMMAGAAAILFDPIFQGMAISPLFGAITSFTLHSGTAGVRIGAGGGRRDRTGGASASRFGAVKDALARLPLA